MFIKSDFTSHAGNLLKWKIECDDLTAEDWQAMAFLVSTQFEFRKVLGIPRGGLKLSRPLEQYEAKDMGCDKILIVDDVYTTGVSMEQFRKDLIVDGIKMTRIRGVVLFSRSVEPVPPWITPIFQLESIFGG